MRYILKINTATNWAVSSILMLVVLISLQLFCSNAHSKTPICTGKSIPMWSSCVGTQIVNGEYIYRGEYQEGKKHGYGVYIVISPQHKGNKYVG